MKYFEMYLYSAYKIYMDLTTPLSNEYQQLVHSQKKLPLGEILCLD